MCEGKGEPGELIATIAVWTSPELLKRVEILAAKLGCDSSEILRSAIAHFLEAEEPRFGMTPCAVHNLEALPPGKGKQRKGERRRG